MIPETTFHFLRPLWLLLLPAGILFFLSLKHKLSDDTPWKGLIAPHLLNSLLKQTEKKSAAVRFLPFALLIAWVLGCIALAGPAWRKIQTPVERSNNTLVIVVDLSPSMQTADLLPDRITRVQRKLIDLFKARKDGLSSIVAYDSNAYTVAPLTDDTRTLSHLARALSPAIMPDKGSNPVAGIQKAVQLLKQHGSRTGSILLLTSGVSPAQTQSITTILNKTSYSLNTLGLGTPEGGPVKNTNGSLLRDKSGAIIFSQLDARSLKKLSSENGGIYRNITIDEQDIISFLKVVDKNITTEKTKRQINQWQDDGIWFVFLLLPVALILFRRGWLCCILLTLIFPFPTPASASESASLWQELWQTDDQQGRNLLDDKRYDDAASKFKDPAWKAEAHSRSGNYNAAAKLFGSLNSAGGFYNQGNALANAGQFKEAIEAYEKALALDNKLTQAKNNQKLLQDFMDKKQSTQKSGSQKNSDARQSEKEQSPAPQSKNDDRQQNSENKNHSPAKQPGNSDPKSASSSTLPDNKAQNTEQSEAADGKKNQEQQKQETQAGQKSSEPEKTGNDEEMSSRSSDTESQQNGLPDKNKPDLSHQRENNQSEIPAEENINRNDNSIPGKSTTPGGSNAEKLSEQEVENWLRKIQGNPANLMKYKFDLQKQERQRRSLQEQMQW